MLHALCRCKGNIKSTFLIVRAICFFQQSFYGAQLVNWLVKNGTCSTRQEAIGLGKDLLETDLIRHGQFPCLFYDSVSWPSGLVHWIQVSGVVTMWVRIPAWLVAALVSLSKTLNHNCFVLRMGRKAVGPVCCVMHVKQPRTLIVKEKGAFPVFLDSRLEHPSRVDMCALQIFCIIFLFLLSNIIFNVNKSWSNFNEKLFWYQLSLAIILSEVLSRKK